MRYSGFHRREAGKSFCPGDTMADAPSPAHATGRPIVRKTTVDLVTDELRDRILTGTLAPGSALRQEALAEQLGVSRIPLREAIRVLGSEGLVDVQPHRGAFVSMLSVREVEEFFELRLKLEPWLLQEAVPKTTPVTLAAAENVVKEMDSARAEQWGRLNWRLHELLYQAADRPQGLAIVRALHEKSERYFRFQVVNSPIRKVAHDEHIELISLYRQRKIRAAGDALARHIEGASQQIVAIVQKLMGESEVKRPATARR
jgi:DNA-binding GntR family transcriptional regulator